MLKFKNSFLFLKKIILSLSFIDEIKFGNFGVELSSQGVAPQVLSSIYNVSQLSSRRISVVPLSTLKTPKQN